MKNHFARNNLSVSSTSSASSTSTLSPGLSPRKGLLSPTEYLLTSPPPSPGLPSLLPRHGKKPQTSWRSRLKRLILVFGALSVLAWLGHRSLYAESAAGYLKGDYEIVGADALPEEPSALMLDDRRGRRKWTVSIPAHHDFPLLPSQYHEICQQAEHIEHELNPSRKKKRHVGYYERDPYFVDVAEAQKQGLLPNMNKDGKIGEVVMEDDPIAGRRPCSKSLTYVMETSDAGMGTTLMGLWLAYGLAKKEGRAFFLDDTRWPYGNYSSYFKAPPHPHCFPPPVAQRLPCPHSARHLVVSAATFPFAFGPSFQAQFSDHKKSTDTLKRRPIFDMIRTGYEHLFELADDGDARHVLERTEKMFPEIREKGGTNVGMHIRRGDVHPLEYQYEKDYLPVTRYMDEARQILIDKYEHDDAEEEEEGEGGEVTETPDNGMISIDGQDPPTSNPPPTPSEKPKPKPRNKRRSRKLNGTGLLPRHGAPGLMASQVFLASDDPDVYVAPELARVLRAQDRIVLASKTVLEAASSGKKNPWVDEIHGWEGGFYRDQFFGLGRLDEDRFRYLGKWKAGPSEGGAGGVMLEDENPDRLDEPGEAAMAMRMLIGRAYLLDLAVLSQADAVVCAVSATGCRVLAVMMGWDRAVSRGLWRNVDAGGGWKGVDVLG